MAYNLASMKKRASSAKSGGTYWKPIPGKTKVRILPGTVGNCDPDTFFREIITHNIKFVDGFKRVNAAPPGKWSPIDACVRIFKEHGMSDEAKNIGPRISFAMNVVLLGDSEVKIWTCSPTQIEKLIGYMEDEDWGDFTDPDDGFCMTITRTGEGMKTRYDVTPSNTKGELPANWEEQAHDLEESAGGDNIDTKQLIAMLSEKFEDQYEDLATELLSSRRKAQRTAKAKLTGKAKKSTKIRKKRNSE